MSMEVYVKPEEEEREVSPIIAIGSVVSLRTVIIPHATTQGKLVPVFENIGQAQAQLTNELSSTGTQPPEASNAAETIGHPLQNQKTGTYILNPYSQSSILQPPSTVLSDNNALANQDQSQIAPPVEARKNVLVQEEIRNANAELEASEGTSIESNQCNSVSTTDDDNNSYPFCKQIGFVLDLKAKSNEKKKLDPHVLTNGIMYEVHKCAKKADGVYRCVVLSILESNFDLCLDSEQQKIGFSKRVVLKLKRVVVRLRCLARLAEKLSYEEQVFTLPDTNNPQKVTPARGVGVLSPVMSSETDVDVESSTISLVKDEYNLKKVIDRKRLVIKMLREKCDTLKEHKAHLKEAKKERGVKLQRAYRDNKFLFSRYKKMKEKLSKMSVCNDGQRENVRTETDPRLVKLKEKVRFWKRMYTETKDELDSFRTQKVPTNGIFNDNIRELYLDLTANKGINCSKVSEVVEAVLNKMLGMKAEALPSASVATNFVLEVDQVTPDTGAAEFVHEHENAEVCMKDGYCRHLEIREQSAGVEVDQFNIVRKMVQDIVAAAVKDKDIGGHQRGIFAKITSLFDDRVVLETRFKELISEYKSDILPKMVKWYDFYTNSEKAQLSCVNEVFCGLHLIDSLAHQAKATLLLWEKMIVEDEEVGANRLSYSSKNALESGTVCLVRTVSDTFQAKDGKPEKFKVFLTRKGEFDDVPLAPFRGNRIDTLFHNAAGAYSIHEELVEFTTTEYLDDNSLLARVTADFEVQQFKAGCRALGLISKIIIDPLFKSMGDTQKMETRYQTLITKLKEWKEDGRQIVEGTACLFDDMEMPKDLVLERLTMWTDSEFFYLTIQIVEVILASFLKVCCTMMVCQLQHESNHLPDGLREKLKAVLKSNVSSEKDLSVLDYLMMAKSKATSIALEGMLMFKKNRTWEWLLSLDKQKEFVKQRVMFRERTRQIERGNLHTSKNMERDPMDSENDATAEEKEVPEKKHKTILEKSAATKRKKPMQLSDALISRKRACNDRYVSVTQQLTTELEQYGGLWDSVTIIDEQLASLCNESKYSAVVCQLQFRRFVLGMKNERGIFNTSVAGRKLSLDNLVSNLKQNVSTVVTASEEPQSVLVNASEQGPQSVDGMLIEHNSVRDREPKLSRTGGSRKGGRRKTLKNAVMNDGEDQLKNCVRTSKKQVEIQAGMNNTELLADKTLNSETLESMDKPTTAQESCSDYFEFDFPYGASALKKAGSTKVAGKQDDTDMCSILFSVDGNSMSDTRIPVVSYSEQLLGKRVKQALNVDGNIEFFSGTVVKMKEENGVNLFQVKYDDLCIDWWIDLWKEYKQNNVFVLPIDFESIIGKKVEQRVANDDGEETWRVGDLSSSAKGDTQYAVMQFDGLKFLLVRVCTLLEDYSENRLRIMS